jgi:DNA-binding transcriptional regulator YdaS (Cro superfamily)
MHDLSLGVKAAVAHFGSQTALAEALDIERSAISQWKKVPINDKHNRVLEIEKASGGAVSRHEMRPDVFGPAPKKKRSRA